VKGFWSETDKAKRRKKRKSGKSNLCPDPAFKYDEAMRPHQSHCESKILETLYSAGKPAAGSSLLLNIDWRNSVGRSKLPCPACKRLLCHAQEKCDLQILLCRAGKDPKPVAC
jgi:hypothetical protein